jgi:hypothetical protein
MGIAGGDKVTEALGGFLRSSALIIASRIVAAFWGVESNQAVNLAI